jgi:predicted GNAT family N-acyltransferase
MEDKSVHVLMLNENNDAIATGRLQLNNADEGQVRSMAVRTDCQGRGYGSEIMDYIEKKATELRLKKITLDAREPAVPFYQKHGYEVIADSYLLFGVIRHFKMSKDLSHI